MARLRALLTIVVIVVALAVFALVTQRERILSPDTAGAPAVGLPSVESFRLENGTEVIAAPISGASKTVVMAWYRVGSADDPANMPGLAHYVEHVTFAALGAHRTKAEARRVPSKGAQPEAFTSHDYTAYYHVVAKEEVNSALRLEATRRSRKALFAIAPRQPARVTDPVGRAIEARVRAIAPIVDPRTASE